MKKICFLLCLLLISINVYAMEGDSSKIIYGDYQYSAIEGNNIQNHNTFIYKDSDFTKSSFKGSKSLEVLSIQVASASLSWYGPDLDVYEVDTKNNAYNIDNFLKAMEFLDVESNKYYNLEKKENSIGVIVGHKTIIQDGKKYTLIAIIPRSAGYKQEWAGNFTIGNSSIHQGFKDARDEVLRFTKYYLNKYNISGDLKIWTAGYSRGAAISNLVGGFFAGGGEVYFNNVNIKPENVYCYTIGTPKSIKDNVSKNIVLSVSGKRNEIDYINDSDGENFVYTKGGVVSLKSEDYNGIRSIVYDNDAFAFLAPKAWGFSNYGLDISSSKGLISEEKAIKELKRISENVYNLVIENGKFKEFKKKTFDLKTLSIVDAVTDVNQIDFFKKRIDALTSKIQSNQIYKDEYFEDGLKALMGAFGMVTNLSGGISLSDNKSGAGPLIYTLLSYASEQLQLEGKANNELDAITYVFEDFISYYTNETIIDSEFTIDKFIELFAKYIVDNENEKVVDTLIKQVKQIVPENMQSFLGMFKIFGANSDISVDDAIKEFFKACYLGPIAGSDASSYYSDASEVRNLLYMTMIIAVGSDIPEINDLLNDGNNNISGNASFKEFVSVMLDMLKKEKDDEGNVVKTYLNMAQLADAKIIQFIDDNLSELSANMLKIYNQEYVNDFLKQVDKIKENISSIRKFMTILFFQSDKGYSTKEILETALTLVDNAYMIAIPHADEIYLAYARNSKRYDEEYDIVKGKDQIYDYGNKEKLTFIYDFDYDEFVKDGKVFIDGKEILKDYYLIREGSTIIEFNQNYVKTLNKGSHTIMVKMNNFEIESDFSLVDEINPKTVDSIYNYGLIFLISLIGIIMVKRQ